MSWDPEGEGGGGLRTSREVLAVLAAEFGLYSARKEPKELHE